MAWKEAYTTTSGRRYRVVYRDTSGAKRSKSFSRARDADVFKIEVERRAQLGPLYEAPPETFGLFWSGWIARYESRGVRPATLDRRRSLAPRLAWLNDRPLDRISAEMVEDEVTKLARAHPRQAQLVLATVKMVLRDAKRRGQRIQESVFEVSPPRAATRTKRFLTVAEVARLADACSEPHLIRFGAYTGLRQGECFALDDSDIDLNLRTVRVRRSAYKGQLGLPKTAAGVRTVPLSSRAVQALREQLMSRPPGTDLIFPAPKGGVWSRENFNARVLRPAAKACGLEAVVFHDLRHTFAALIISKAAAHPKVLQVLMGHHSFKVTMDTYGHLYDEDKTAALEALDRAIGVGSPTSAPLAGDRGVASG